MTVVDRAFLTDLLIRWRDGKDSAEDVQKQARTLWISGAAPEGDSVATDVLLMLATARSGLLSGDISALLEFLATQEDREADGRERFYSYIESIDFDQREASNTGGYHRPPSGVDEEDPEFFLPRLEQRRLRRAVRLDPESVWEEIRATLCGPPTDDEEFLTGLLEILVDRHAEAFIERVEKLAADCQAAHERLVSAYIGDVASTMAVDRFGLLQDRLWEAMTLEASSEAPRQRST